ncbi:MAG: hypothetical protein ACOC0D_02310 [Spirochaeta sp.]
MKNAMNITPSPSDSSPGDFTIVGSARLNRRSGTVPGLSVLVLHRGGRFNRVQQFSDLERLGVREILAVEPKASSYDVEQLANRFSRVKFLLMQKELNPGQMINLGIQESSSSHVLVIWNNIKVQSISDRVLQAILSGNQICAVPLFRNERSEVIPSMFMPAFYKRTIRLIPAVPSRDGQCTIFPHDYIGIYDAQHFLSLGGYDTQIASPYWQKMDFGMRSYLWGSSITCSVSFRVSSSTSSVPEDTTPNIDYLRFFLKNIAIRFSGDSGYLPRSIPLRLLLHRSFGLLDTWREYRRIKHWVDQNRFRYTQDARHLLELWEDQ